MFTLNDDLSIYATRGDIVFFSVSAEDKGVPYTFKAGDVVRIKVYGKKDAENVVLQKDFPVTEECAEVEIFLGEEDTKIGEVISKHKDYWYEVELNPYNNPQTIIGYDEDGAKVFRLFPEGDDIPEFVPEPEDIAVMDDELDMVSTRPVQNQAIARAVTSLRADFEETRNVVEYNTAQTAMEVANIDAAVAVERARIDNLVASAVAPIDGETSYLEVADIRVGADSETYGSAGTAVRAQFSKINKSMRSLFEMGRNLIDPLEIEDNCMIDEGVLKTPASQYSITGYIAVNPGESYWFSFPTFGTLLHASSINSCRTVNFYTDTKQYLSQVENVQDFTVPENAYYVRITFHTEAKSVTSYDPCLFAGVFTGKGVNVHPFGHTLNADVDGASITDKSITASKLSEDILTTGKNLFDASKCENGYLVDHGFDLGGIGSDYSTSDYIPVKAGVSYAISPYQRFYSLYDENRDLIIRYNSYNIGTTVVVPDVDGYMRVSFLTEYLNEMQVEVGEVATDYEAYRRVLAGGISLSAEQIAYLQSIFSSNVLYGKKWVACGDSFTAGGSSGVFTEGKYAGKDIAYPYFIAMRNNMNLVNEAQSGSTMTYIEGKSKCFSDVRYKNIDADADYITLYFGINDYNYDAPLGTIDDTKNTTFYGAWNVVMEHIITNHPTAKIGIIITNGSKIDYANAEIAIAEKWGIPYLNMATGVLVPTMHRTNKNLPASVVNARLRAFAVDLENGDTHPNAFAHEYESTFIENWLRSL